MDGDSVGQNPNIRNFVNPPCWLWFSPFDQNRIPASLTNANATGRNLRKGSFVMHLWRLHLHRARHWYNCTIFFFSLISFSLL